MGQVELVLAAWAALVAVLVSSQEPPGGYYQTKYDALDVEDVLNHKRLVQYYAACLMNRGPCPPQGLDLKRILPEALDTNCLRCTEKQKLIILKTARRLMTEYSTIWKELLDFWDPTGERVRKFHNSIDTSFGLEDEANFIGNRFGDSDSGNDLAAPVRPYPNTLLPITSKPETTLKPTTISTPTTTSKHPTNWKPYPGSSATAGPGVSYLPPSTTTTRRTTTTPKPTATKAKPTSSSSTQKVDSSASSDTNRPSFLSVWQITTLGSDGSTKPPSYGWRPKPTQAPLNFPLIKFDAGVRLLGSLGELGTRVLQAGTEVAGMVLSKVHELVNTPVN